MAPPLVIDFRDGAVRAAECTACAAVWWRGPDLEALALELAGPKVSEADGMITA